MTERIIHHSSNFTFSRFQKPVKHKLPHLKNISLCFPHTVLSTVYTFLKPVKTNPHAYYSGWIWTHTLCRSRAASYQVSIWIWKTNWNCIGFSFNRSASRDMNSFYNIHLERNSIGFRKVIVVIYVHYSAEKHISSSANACQITAGSQGLNSWHNRKMGWQ